MTTERDIRNQIRYAEKKGRNEGKEEQAIETARRMLAMGLGPDVITKATGLPEEQIKAL